MLKNWIVKTKQIKKKEIGFINHVNYLSDVNRCSHHYTNITILNNKSHRILDAVSNRVDFRRKNGLRGGGVSNYATAFVLSLPRDIKQPDLNDWKKISVELIRDLAAVNNIDVNVMAQHCHVVLHDESKSIDKPSHIHVLVSNVIDNQVVKSISQYRSTDAVKKSLNRSVRAVLGVDNRTYLPRQKNTKNRPLWVMRAENLFKIESATKLLIETRDNLKAWVSSIEKMLFRAAERHSETISENLNEIERVAPILAAQLDSEVERIEIEHDIPEPSKVSTKRRRRRRRI